MRNQSIFWGVILVLIGGLLMAQNMNLLPPNINIWAIFWPLVLVLIGLRILLRSTRRGAYKEESLRLPLEETRLARIGLHHGAGELRIDDQAGPDELLSGTFGGGVEQHVSRSGDETTVDLRVPGENIPSFVFPFDAPDNLNWTIGLNPTVPVALSLEVGASRNLLNLRNLQVRELRLQTGASASEIDMPAQGGQTRAWVRSGAASVEVRIPQGVAARVHASGGLAAINVDSGRFPRVGSGASNEYRSPDYETATNRVDLDIETGVGSVSVR